jgi:hypothetical protein
MSISIYVTEIKIVDPKTATVSMVIDSSDLGRLQFDVAAEPGDGDSAKILHHVRSRLEQFGRELADVSRPQHQLRISVPPQLK